MFDALVLTCEHGGCRVPARWRALLGPRTGLLNSHRGRDQGALEVARQLQRALGAPLVAATVTRLLVDLNRSLDHPEVFSHLTGALPEDERQRIVERHYRPHRAAVRAALDEALAAPGGVLHVGVHSFTPVVRRQPRKVDVGVLFDPARPLEAAFAARWIAALRGAEPRLRVEANEPFLGVDDGLTTALRREYPEDRYAGVELEVNQRLVRKGGPRWERLKRALCVTLGSAAGRPVH